MQESLSAKASYTKMETVWIEVSALGKYKVQELERKGAQGRHTRPLGSQRVTDPAKWCVLSPHYQAGGSRVFRVTTLSNINGKEWSTQASQ